MGSWEEGYVVTSLLLGESLDMTLGSLDARAREAVSALERKLRDRPRAERAVAMAQILSRIALDLESLRPS